MHVSVQLQHLVAQSRLIVGSKCYDYNMCVCIGVHDHLDPKVPVVKPPCSTLHPFPTLTPSSPLVAPPPDVVPLLALPATVVELPSAATVWVPWRYCRAADVCRVLKNRIVSQCLTYLPHYIWASPDFSWCSKYTLEGTDHIAMICSPLAPSSALPPVGASRPPGAKCWTGGS